MEWTHSEGLVNYDDALAAMQARVAAIHVGEATEQVWLLEHPPLYTAGTSAKGADLIDARFPVYEAGRGGQYTYHGPGQRIAYVMLDLKARALRGQQAESSVGEAVSFIAQASRPEQEEHKRTPDIRLFVQQLEAWLIATLAHFGITGELREGRVGVWVQTPMGEKKIAALGIRLKHWVSFHGISLNVSPDLSHYSGIVPCGLSQYGVTSLHDLGVTVSMDEVDTVLKDEFQKHFGQI